MFTPSRSQDLSLYLGAWPYGTQASHRLRSYTLLPVDLVENVPPSEMASLVSVLSVVAEHIRVTERDPAVLRWLLPMPPPAGGCMLTPLFHHIAALPMVGMPPSSEDTVTPQEWYDRWTVARYLGECRHMSRSDRIRIWSLPL